MDPTLLPNELQERVFDYLDMTEITRYGMMNREAYALSRDNAYWRARARKEGYPEELLHADNMYERYFDLLTYSCCLISECGEREHYYCLVEAITSDNYEFLNYLLNNYDQGWNTLLDATLEAIVLNKSQMAKLILDKIGTLSLTRDRDYYRIREILDVAIHKKSTDLLISILDNLKATSPTIFVDTLVLLAIYDSEDIAHIRDLYDLDRVTFIDALETLIYYYDSGSHGVYNLDPLVRLLDNYDWNRGDLNVLADQIVDVDLLRTLMRYGFDDLQTVYDIAIDDGRDDIADWIETRQP